MHGIGRRAAARLLTLAVLAAVFGGAQAASAEPPASQVAVQTDPSGAVTLPTDTPPADWWW